MDKGGVVVEGGGWMLILLLKNIQPSADCNLFIC